MRTAIICLTQIFLFNMYCASAQSQEKIYALHLVSFAKGILWPTQTINESLKIGILGYEPLLNELRISVQNIKISGRSIEVVDIVSPEHAARVDIIFIPAYKGKLISKVLDATQNKPVLIVSNKGDVAHNGGGIDFIIKDGKSLYQINCKSIENRGMKVGVSVKTYGILIQ